MRDSEHSRSVARLLRKTPSPPVLKSLHISGIQPFQTQTFSFAHPLTVFCGANGVGKSALLRVVRGLLAGKTASRGDGTAITFPEQVSLSADLLESGADAGAQSNSASPSVSTVTIDPIDIESATNVIRNRLFQADDALEQFDRQPADSSRLALLSRILRKEYAAFATVEIDDIEGVDPTPFFEVESNGIKYDSRTMGRGELAISYILWHVDRTPNNGVIFLEEPEIAIAPFSQRILIHYLADVCLRRNLSLVIATQSPVLIAEVPISNLRLVHQSSIGVGVLVPQRQSELRDALGVDHPVRAVVFVEDGIARILVSQLFELLAFSLSSECDIAIAGSDGEVIAAIKKLPPRTDRVAFLGILDGDSKNDPQSDKCILQLPGNSAPDAILYDVFRRNIPEMATALRRPETAVAMHFANLTGLDHHDWLPRISDAMAVSQSSIIQILVDIWLRDVSVKRQAVDMVGKIKEFMQKTI